VLDEEVGDNEAMTASKAIRDEGLSSTCTARTSARRAKATRH